MAKKPMKAPPKGGKVVKRARGGPMGGPMPQGFQPGGPPPGMPSQSAMNQMGGIPVAAAQAAQLQQMARGIGGGLGGGPPPPPPPMRSAGGMRGAGVQAVKKGGSVKKMAKGGSAKRDADYYMRNESSRAIDAMPYTETKPKAKAPPPKKPAPKPSGKRDADWYMRNETAMPGKFKRGGKVKKMASGGKVTKKKYV